MRIMQEFDMNLKEFCDVFISNPENLIHRQL